MTNAAHIPIIEVLARRANHSDEMMRWIRHRLERLHLSGSVFGNASPPAANLKTFCWIWHRRICHRNGKIEEDVECARYMPGALSFSQEIARAADVREKTAEAAEMGAAARPPCRGGGVLRRADSAEDRLNREGYP